LKHHRKELQEDFFKKTNDSTDHLGNVSIGLKKLLEEARGCRAGRSTGSAAATAGSAATSVSHDAARHWEDRLAGDTKKQRHKL